MWLVTSYTEDSQPLLEPLDREFIQHMLLTTAAYSGVEVVAYVVANSNFQALLRVPKKSAADAALTDAEVLRRVRAYYGQALHDLWAEECRAGDRNWKFRRRWCLHGMHHLARFMKTFKHRVSIWVNDNNPKPTSRLWAERYYGYAIEDNPRAILAAAAAVEMSLVHSRLVDDPADYRWCSHARAQAGDLVARHSLMARVPVVFGLEPKANWASVSKTWREFLLNREKTKPQTSAPAI